MNPVAWLGSAPLLWFLLGTVLLGLALLGVDSDGLILIAGLTALLLSLATSLLPVPPVLAALLFVLVGAVGYAWLRRWSRRQREAIPPSSTSAERAEVISGFGSDDPPGEAPCRDQGRVLWQGQSWAADNLEPDQPLQPGSQVTVMGREGTRLQVLPVSRRT
jgi:membrane protein implicated in regulation of membrane protease activity